VRPVMRSSTEIQVLIIENCREMGETLSVAIQLRWPDATLHFTLEGAGGLRLVRMTRPDVVVLDLDLGSMDALEVLSQIRLFSDVPVIVLGKGDDELRRVRALEAGADDCISKPFSPLEFLASLNALLRRTGTREVRDRHTSLSTAATDRARQAASAEKEVTMFRGGRDVLSYLVRNEERLEEGVDSFETHPFLLLTRDSRN
jgi:DNA-binding response OmpR family regulator